MPEVYELEYKAGEAGEWAALATLPTSAAEYDQGGLSSGVVYFARVRLVVDGFPGPWSNEASVSYAADALTATDITTGAPALGSPTLGQSHTLTASGITSGAPALGAPTLGQTHVLMASGLTSGAPALGSPALSQDVVHTLVAVGLTSGTPTLGAPALGQVHVLGAMNLVVPAPVLEGPALVQIHLLAALSLEAGAVVLGSPVLALVLPISPEDIRGFVVAASRKVSTSAVARNVKSTASARKRTVSHA